MSEIIKALNSWLKKYLKKESQEPKTDLSEEAPLFGVIKVGHKPSRDHIKKRSLQTRMRNGDACKPSGGETEDGIGGAEES
ncbi:hypothetical protein HID58_025937 [Brassica napus]|uniref:Uncharacterized protein n=2 Tax=Brassica TaxID=3705 RepID=M4D6X4_BRACM|nr:hypothetical protein HID58_025937 [Brassica napus]CAF2162783.1 unnamed protein product [Brassica napus]